MKSRAGKSLWAGTNSQVVTVTAKAAFNPALVNIYFSGMNRLELVAPIPGRPCLTGL